MECAHLLYPPVCLECSETVRKGSDLFCDECQELLSVIEPCERCLYCFSQANLHPTQQICRKCFRDPPLFNRVGSVFDYYGPAQTLIKHLKYANRPYLADGAGAFLAYQFYQLKWPKPDYIIPVPLSVTHLMTRGYNQAELLAKSLGKLLDCPVQNVLKRQNGKLNQTSLDRTHRILLEEGTFYLKRNSHLIRDQRLLLIDDVMTTGTTLNRCAEALMEQCPNGIYALTFCRALS